MDIYDNIRNGVYQNKSPYFSRKVNPVGREMYLSEERKLFNQFKQDLFDYCGVSDNPKRELLFSKAWESGHSSGYNEVAIIFDDMVELIT